MMEVKMTRLNDIMSQEEHWVIRGEKNPLTREKVCQICHDFNGGESVHVFSEHVRKEVGEHIDSNLIIEIWNRREEFKNEMDEINQVE